MENNIYKNTVYIPFGHAVLRTGYAKDICKYVMIMYYTEDYHEPGKPVDHEFDRSNIVCALLFDSPEHVKRYADVLQNLYERSCKSDEHE